jgi:phenylacetate-CoA ligase
MFDVDVETRAPTEQTVRDDGLYRKQVDYLFARSPFYQRKLRVAGFKGPADVGGIDHIPSLPFTVKDELRQTQAEVPPFGDHLAADPITLLRVYSTSGTTGTPCFIALTRNDTVVWATNTARSYRAAGFKPGQRLVVAFNAGPFVAGAGYYGFDMAALTVIPVGIGNTERLIKALQILGGGNAALSCTPSYALYLIDWCNDRDIDPHTLGVKNISTAGEPGGGDTAIRSRVEGAFGCILRECMGIGDISTSIWGECEHGAGMHFSARDDTYVELIDPVTQEQIPWENGAQGEIVYTSLVREAMPMLRLRSRDHVVVNARPCSCGRTSQRIRCIGRTDDMLIVRGVNLFPTAVRDVLREFETYVGGHFRITPKKRGVAQDPPLPLRIELGQGLDTAPADLADRITKLIRTKLLVTVKVEFVPRGTFPREEYKSKLVDYSDAV